MRRYTRLSNGFSRKLANQAAATALNYFVYIKIHRTLRTSPAMAAGVTDRQWSVEDLGSLRTAEGGKSGVTKSTLRFVCGAAFIWLPFWSFGRFLVFGIFEPGAAPRHWFIACYILAQLAGIAFLASTVSRKHWVLSLLSVASMIVGLGVTLALGFLWFSK
jgi:hypothetical protein